MLTQIEGYFRAGQPTRYLPQSVGALLDGLRFGLHPVSGNWQQRITLSSITRKHPV